jgi:DNA-binding transcriptional LysR family regulator
VSAVIFAASWCNFCTTTGDTMRHLKIYRTIRAIHRHGSIRKAAETLAISPSALNRALQGFEEELGVPVFERVPGGVELTAAGELLIVQIDRHLIEFDDLHRDLRKLRDGLTGHIALSLAPDVDCGLILSALAAFEAANPGVSVSVFGANSLSLLHQRRVDFAIATAPETSDKVDVLYAKPIDIAAWCAPGMGPVDGLWDLVGDRLIVPPQGTGSHAVFRHVLRRLRLAAPVTTTAAASQMPGLLHATPRACIAPAISMALPPGPVAVPIRACTLGQTQLTILRAAGVPMRKAAAAAAQGIQAALEAEAS